MRNGEIADSTIIDFFGAFSSFFRMNSLMNAQTDLRLVGFIADHTAKFLKLINKIVEKPNYLKQYLIVKNPEKVSNISTQ